VTPDQHSLTAVKRFETARARAALRGVALHALDDDRGAPLFVASWNALTRQFADLVEVEAWLTTVDGVAS
jgi:hypothetical protein